MLPFNAGVAGQIPHAVGLGWGLRLRGEDSVVVVHFGEGATSQGDFHEAINLAGVQKAPVIFFCQNNEWAISTPREIQTAAARFAQKAIAYGFPGVQVDGNDLFAVVAVSCARPWRARGEATARRSSRGSPTGSACTRRPTTAPAASRRDCATRGARRIRCSGCSAYLARRGRWNEAIEQAMDAEITARSMPPGPRRRRRPPNTVAESLGSRLRGDAQPLGRTAAPTSKEAVMAEMSIVEAVRDALTFEMARDERVMMLGEDVGGSGGVFRATDGLQARFGTARVVDAPLGESAIIGSAVGLAVAGLVPVAEIQFLGFAHNAFNQIVEQLARLRYRSWGTCRRRSPIRAPFGGGVRAPEMHSDGFEAHFAHAPGLKVVAPSNAGRGAACCCRRSATPTRCCSSSRCGAIG
jgi:2-oxoisovalerate dehydrogenase E1 component